MPARLQQMLGWGSDLLASFPWLFLAVIDAEQIKGYIVAIGGGLITCHFFYLRSRERHFSRSVKSQDEVIAEWKAKVDEREAMIAFLFQRVKELSQDKGPDRGQEDDEGEGPERGPRPEA